jgi:hypothetical protein
MVMLCILDCLLIKSLIYLKKITFYHYLNKKIITKQNFHFFIYNVFTSFSLIN